MIEIERYFGFAVNDNDAIDGLNDLIFKSDSFEDAEKKLIAYTNKGHFIGDSVWITDMKTLKTIIRQRG